MFLSLSTVPLSIQLKKLVMTAQRAGLGVTKKIIVEDGCWIGHTTILPGVRIAKGCVIGANSLITKDTEKNGLYVGAPAIRIKTI